LTLSSDATPDLVAALPQLNPTQQAFALTQLQNTRSWLEDHAASVGWPGWHYSQSRAIAELRTVLP
ncbi:MAG: hypothetical protein HGA65_07565, partial [Oscillochloris sp.]|nr:hypothetical protein [Oscillochloris sp.]